MDTGEDSLFTNFFKVADAKQRGIAISFAGRAYINIDDVHVKDNFPDKNKLMELWQLRIKQSSDIEELKEFGWWIKPGVFDNRWMLEMLDSTLEKTKGIISADFDVFKALRTLTEDFPYLTTSSLYRMIRVINDRYFMRENEIREILKKISDTNDEKSLPIAKKIIDHLLKIGFETLRTIEFKAEDGE